MKKILKTSLFTIIAATIILASCDDLFGDLTTFDSDYTYFEFKIYPQELGAYVFLTKTQDSDLTEVLEDNGFDESNIDKVKLKEATFEVMNSDQSINFNGLGSFGASFLDNDNIETKIAEINPVPENSREVSLTPKDVDIAKFLKEAEYTFLAFGVIDEVFSDTIEVRAKIKYEVKGKL
jgi:hypothetical protein